MMFRTSAGMLAAGMVACIGFEAQAQSSSLYSVSADKLDEIAAARYDQPKSRRHQPDVHADVPGLTMFVSQRPKPREFMINDLVTVVVRESFSSEMESEKSTEKKSELKGGINQLPRLTLKDLLNLQIKGNSDTAATVDIGLERSYEGEGEYERSESMAGRVRARIIDIKPNGMLVLEARRTVINDKEQSVLVATGNCMPEDISAANMIESSQLENLFIDKQHSGDLRDANEKGWLTRLSDAIFDF